MLQTKTNKKKPTKFTSPSAPDLETSVRGPGVPGPCSLHRLQGGSFPPLPSLGTPGVPGLVTVSLPSASVSTWLLLWVCISSSVPSQDTVPGCGATLTQDDLLPDPSLIPPAKTLFPNKVPHPGSEGQEVVHSGTTTQPTGGIGGCSPKALTSCQVKATSDVGGTRLAPGSAVGQT